MEGQRKVVFGTHSINVPMETTPAEARGIMAQVFPEVKNAEYKPQGDEYHFVAAMGSKGC